MVHFLTLIAFFLYSERLISLVFPAHSKIKSTNIFNPAFSVSANYTKPLFRGYKESVTDSFSVYTYTQKVRNRQLSVYQDKKNTVRTSFPHPGTQKMLYRQFFRPHVQHLLSLSCFIKYRKPAIGGFLAYHAYTHSTLRILPKIRHTEPAAGGFLAYRHLLFPVFPLLCASGIKIRSSNQCSRTSIVTEPPYFPTILFTLLIPYP